MLSGHATHEAFLLTIHITKFTSSPSGTAIYTFQFNWNLWSKPGGREVKGDVGPWKLAYPYTYTY